MPILNSTFRTLDAFPQESNKSRAQQIIDRFKDRPGNGFMLIDLPIDGDRIIRPESDADLSLSSELPEHSFRSDIDYICDRIDLMIADIRHQLLALGTDRPFDLITIEASKLDHSDDESGGILGVDPTTGFHIDLTPEKVFIAFGEVANIECISGPIEVSYEGASWNEEDQAVSFATKEAISKDRVTVHSIPNGVPVLMNKDTVHQRGAVLSEGFRLRIALKLAEV